MPLNQQPCDRVTKINGKASQASLTSLSTEQLMSSTAPTEMMYACIHNINRSSTKVHCQRWHSLGRSSIESMTIGVSPLNGTYPYQCLDCKVKTRHQSKWSLTWSLCWMWTRQKTSLILTLRYGRSIKPLRVCGTVPLTLQLGEYTLMYTLNILNLFRYCIQ